MTDAATSLATPTIATVATAAAAAALSTWGSWAIVLVVLGWMLWRSHQDNLALKAEKALLQVEIKELQDKRLQDSRELIRVTESSTALQQARTQGDQVFLTVMQDLAAEMAALRTSKDGIAGNRQLLEDLVAMLETNRPAGFSPRPRLPPQSRAKR